MLDWLHIAVRVEQALRTAPGVSDANLCIRNDHTFHQIERAKRILWHGNVFGANEALSNRLDDIEGAQVEREYAGRPRHMAQKKLH